MREGSRTAITRNSLDDFFTEGNAVCLFVCKLFVVFWEPARPPTSNIVMVTIYYPIYTDGKVKGRVWLLIRNKQFDYSHLYQTILTIVTGNLLRTLSSQREMTLRIIESNSESCGEFQLSRAG